MIDPKQVVASGYDRCARAYASARACDASPELLLLAERLSSSARILDIGCGAGLPVTAALARLGTVVGVDISANQLELARNNVPSAELIHGDIMTQQFGDASFDAVVAFYSLFHLPRGEQYELLSRVSRWVRPGGYFLATLARSDHAGYTEDSFFGATMYWSHYETSWYTDQVVRMGFEILHLGELGHGYREVSSLPPERHPVIFAQMRSLPNPPLQPTAEKRGKSIA
jgi:ubiquinone/menaquinone biosynthesis C-methylase UbiE